MKKVLVLILSIIANYYNSFSQSNDSIITRIAPSYDQVGMLHRFWFGDSYRKLYNTPVKMRVMNLSEEKGGLEIVKLGGGMQTQSLRLSDPSGREWVLRSIQKYPERSLPESLRNTIAKDIVQDQISIAHPFGALTVPIFNDALSIPHAKPELVYLGDDERFGEYRSVFSNRAYMFEPRMPFEDSKTDNTTKVIRKVLEDNDTQVDQDITLNARLLDFVLGDWDRHEDNWRWYPEKEDGKKIYTVVPRDRDKVFYKTSGVFPILLSYQWLKANVQPFGPTIRNISHWNFNARHFDRFFLNSLDKKDWEKRIGKFQEKITDSLIQHAMHEMPDTIVRLSANDLMQNIKARRDGLLASGLEYYAALANVVDIPLSEKNEFIHIIYEELGQIRVDIHNKKKDGTAGRRLYKRTFKPGETKEIRIYGIAGQDEYKIVGAHKSSIKLRMIGGDGYDKYDVSSDFVNGNKVWLYESKKDTSNRLSLSAGVKLRLSTDSNIHRYEYDNFVYDRKGILFNLNYGVDRGLILGLGYQIENQGFRKKPFADKHEFLVNYLTGRQSFSISYSGIFKKFIGNQDLLLNVKSAGPFNQSNFFGYGNNSEYDRDIHEIDFYRNRYDLVNADALLEYDVIEKFKVYYGFSSDFYRSSLKDNKKHFFAKWDVAYPDERVFEDKLFAGITGGFEYDTRNNTTNAKSGIWWQTRVEWRTQFGFSNRNSTNLESSFSYYKTISQDKITLANRIGLKTVFGNPYFFQHAMIGGENSLRGFNSQRFTGKTALYNNFETRVKIFSYDSALLPGTVGVIGFYDIGRVWITNESSNKWHMGSGGGLYFIPADLITIQAVVGASKDAVLPYIRIGLSF